MTIELAQCDPCKWNTPDIKLFIRNLSGGLNENTTEE